MITIEDLTLHDLNEVATLLGLSRGQVQARVTADELAAVHHGGRLMVAAEEIERFRLAYTPPVRVPRVGVTRRFRPPARPADLPEVG